MTERLESREDEFARHAAIPRPQGWGGYRLYIRAIEFWVAGPDRFHQRLRYECPDGGDWSRNWLQP
jgi:pyridoxamine 5'-phosphate oxidase